MPNVSVIIPAYNGDRFIAEAIESVLEQTYKDYEIIVVNDGSTDATEQVLEPYQTHIRYIAQTNQGVAAARNRGIGIAQGEFIAFLDQDDTFLPQKLAAQTVHLEANPHVGIVHSGWQRINQNGNLLGDVTPWHKAPNLDLEAWLWWKPVLLSAMMIRKSWLEQIGRLNTSFKQVCDLDLVLRLALTGCKANWLPQVLTSYREHDRNDSLNTPLQVYEHEQVLDTFFASPHLSPTIRRLERRCRYHTLVWSAWRLYVTNNLTEMAHYLEKSLLYTPFFVTETVLDWITNFAIYSSEDGSLFNVYSLSQSQQWQELIENCLLSHRSLA